MIDQINTSTRYLSTTSEKFAPIRTADALDALGSAGWDLVSTKVAKTRDENRRPFVKHAAILAYRGDQSTLAEYTPRILLTNSNEGTSSFKLMAGLFRAICLNGVVVGTSIGGIKIRHMGDPTEIRTKIVTAASNIREQMPHLARIVENFRALPLTRDEVFQFSTVAAAIRFPKLTGDALQEAGRVFDVVRREEDKENNLWTTFNRVQETAMRGGVQVNNRRSRRLTSMTRDIAVNQSLWDLALDTQAGRLTDRFNSVIHEADLVVGSN